MINLEAAFYDRVAVNRRCLRQGFANAISNFKRSLTDNLYI
ncbi:hypothetical protein ACEYW6_30675 [Nostoc sp. UIC 10607]|nr:MULTISPECIES: hypothetical protein [Nostoc]